tara:strand:+ start:165 stop:1112 length:948 start_codon:yes stop_codon:yes gene_type:complete
VAYKKPKEYEKVCVVCSKTFITGRQNKLTCSRACKLHRNSQYHKKKAIKEGHIGWDKSPRNCVQCDSVYIPTQWHQKFCSKECSAIVHKMPYVKKGRFEEKRCCENCGKEYTALSSRQQYCGSECLKAATKEKTKEKNRLKKEKLLKEGCRIYTPSHFDDLIFYDEEQFHHWFNQNFSLYGLKKIHKSDRFFPDVIAETYDGKVLRIELEYFASNFEKHEHDSESCDLLICYVKKETTTSIKGVPIISMFDIPHIKAHNWQIANMNDKSLSCYFINIVNSLNNNLDNYMRTDADCQNIELCDYIQQYSNIVGDKK